MNHEFYMDRALELASRGIGFTSPNPAVGAVLVADGKIVGDGYHERAGALHAEAVAIRAAGSAARGAVLYCTLEPCCHRTPEKRTPPCTDAIIAAGVRLVVVATADPNPHVSGRGIAVLRDAGIEVIIGVRQAEATRMNEPFFRFIRTGVPFVHLKTAQSIDGYVATNDGESKWITPAAARREVHALRARYDAVLVGAGTVRADNPTLTVRDAVGENPVRIVLTSACDVPTDSAVFDHAARTIVFTGEGTPTNAIAALENVGATVVPIRRTSSGADPPGRLDPHGVLTSLAAHGLTSVLIEGGPGVATSFLVADAVDRVTVFIAPRLFGDGKRAFGDLGRSGLDDAPAYEAEWRSIDGCGVATWLVDPARITGDSEDLAQHAVSVGKCGAVPQEVR